MFYQVSLSPQVKRWAIITYKHVIYELPHEMPNDLRLTNVGVFGLSSPRPPAPGPQPPENLNFLKLNII